MSDIKIIISVIGTLLFSPIANAQLYMYVPGNKVPKQLPKSYKDKVGEHVIVQLGRYKCTIDDLPNPSAGTRYTMLYIDVGLNTLKILEQTLPQVDFRYDDNHIRYNTSSIIRKFKNEKSVALIDQQAMDSFVLRTKINGKVIKSPCYYNDK
jgi:hypothetical protein